MTSSRTACRDFASHCLIEPARRQPEAPPALPPEAQHTSSSAAHAAPSAPGKTPEQTSSKPTARTQAAAVRHWVRFPLPWQAPAFRRLNHTEKGLPSSVHHRRTSLDFPTRPAAPSARGEAGIFRFPRKAFPYVLGVCERAGARDASQYRRPGCGLPPPPTASAPQSNCLSRLDTRPARTPVNASPRPRGLRCMTRGRRGSLSLRSYDSFIHNNPAGFARRTGGAK